MCKCDFCDYCEKTKLNPFYVERTCMLSPNGDQQKRECKHAEDLFHQTVESNQYMNESRVWVVTKGVLTPGGDPLWHCPNCDKGTHLYGIESPEGYKTKCPDCGAPLIYPYQKSKSI